MTTPSTSRHERDARVVLAISTAGPAVALGGILALLAGGTLGLATGCALLGLAVALGATALAFSRRAFEG